MHSTGLFASLTERDVCVRESVRSKTPDDADAVRIKCVALIRLEKFDKALELAVKYDNLLSNEKAYCLYRLKRVSTSIVVHACMGGR